MSSNTNKNPDYINLTLWIDNTTLFHNIKTYLCHVNSDMLHYIIDGKRHTIYKNLCAYKSRGYMTFLNHIDNLSKFQKIFKLYYKDKRDKINMFQKQIYIVSVIDEGHLPKIRMFFKKSHAVEFAFNEAKDALGNKITYSEDGNYILNLKKSTLTITTHHTTDIITGATAGDSILLECSSKIKYNKHRSIDLNDSGILTEEESAEIQSAEIQSDNDENDENDENYENDENNDENRQHNVFMDLVNEYSEKSNNVLFNIFSYKITKNETHTHVYPDSEIKRLTFVQDNIQKIKTDMPHLSSFDTIPRLTQESFLKLNNDVNFWESDDNDTDNDNNDDTDNDNDNDNDDTDNDNNEEIDAGAAIDENDNDNELSLHDFYENYKIENEPMFTEREICLVMKQTNVSKEEAENSLVNNKGDVLNAVLELKM